MRHRVDFPAWFRGKPCFFLDRDGVINELVIRDGEPHGSPRNYEEFVIRDGVPKMLGEASRLGVPVIVITNQPDLGRGKIDIDQLMKINLQLFQMGILAIYMATSGDRSSLWRKPRPKMISDALEEFQLSAEGSIMLGDNLSDMQAAKDAGVMGILFENELNTCAHGSGERNFRSMDKISEFVTRHFEEFSV